MRKVEKPPALRLQTVRTVRINPGCLLPPPRSNSTDEANLQGLQITPCRQSLSWKCPIKRMMWSYCNAVRQPRYDWTVISTDTTNYGEGNREFLFRKVIPSCVFTIKVIWWPLVFISQPRGLLRDSCEWLVSWVSASSLWRDIQLLRLPPCSPKPTHQLAFPPAHTASVAQNGHSWSREGRGARVGVGDETAAVCHDTASQSPRWQ